MRAARCHHGRPRAGAGVHDPRPAGVGQVGPRVVASLETPCLLSPRRGLWALLPHSGSWRERGRDPRAGVPGCRGSGCSARGGLPTRASFCLASQRVSSGYFTTLVSFSKAFPGFLIVVGRINWLRFCFKITALLLREKHQWLKARLLLLEERPCFRQPVTLVGNPRDWPQVRRV